jgi:hypothetical protein
MYKVYHTYFSCLLIPLYFSTPIPTLLPIRRALHSIFHVLLLPQRYVFVIFTLTLETTSFPLVVSTRYLPHILRLLFHFSVYVAC